MEQAERWSSFDGIVQNIKERNAETDSDELQRIIDDAVREVRDERRSKGTSGRA